MNRSTIWLLSLVLMSFSLLPPVSTAQQTHASLSEQKTCADQAKKFFNETDYSDNSKHPVKNEFTSHYDATSKVCYVRIDYNHLDSGTKVLSVGSYVFDAFEGRNFASYIWFSDPKKKYWEVKPMECWVKPIKGSKTECKSTEEFEELVDRFFGLGE